MALSSNTEFSLGSRLPVFTLTNAVDGQSISANSLHAPNGVLVMFLCNHCPYVVHVRPEVVKVAHLAIDNGFDVLAINSNSTRTHPQDGPSNMKELAQRESWRFPFVFDSTQEVAKAFGAACTPEFYLFNGEHRLVYHGRLDDSSPGNNRPLTGRDLRTAIDAVLAGRMPDPLQHTSIGCSIKWD